MFDNTIQGVVYQNAKGEITKTTLIQSGQKYDFAYLGTEVSALKYSFPDHYKNITITNIKGLTGSTLGAATEDAIMVKALQKGKAPCVPNLKNIPEEFSVLIPLLPPDPRPLLSDTFQLPLFFFWPHVVLRPILPHY